MKILLMSDTHAYMDDKLLEYVDQADEVWHAGDIGNLHVTDTIQERRPLRAVYGNIDGTEIRKEFPLEQDFVIDGYHVCMIHIGGHPKRYAKGIKNKLKLKKPHLFICGHSHILKVVNDHELNLLHMNPGAVGKQGFHQKRTILRFEIKNAQIKNLEVIDLGKRGQLS